MRAINLVTVLLLLSACGVTVNGRHDDMNNSNGDYKYRLKENDCDTGDHSFSNKADYCRALDDDQLNHGCAADLRQKLKQQNCGT